MNTKNPSQIKKIILAFVLFAIGIILPDIGMITSFGWCVIFSFAALIFCNINRLPSWITAVMVLIYCIVNQVSFVRTMVSAWFGNLSIWILFTALWFCAGLRESGMVDFLSNKILSLKIARRGPYWLMFIIMLTSFVAIAITQSYMPIMILLLELTKGIKEKMKLKETNAWVIFTCIGICIGAACGSATVPWAFMSQSMIAIYNSMGLVDFNVLMMCVIMVLAWAALTAVFIAVCKYIVRPEIDASIVDSFEVERNKQYTSAEKRALWAAVAAIAVVIVILTVPALLPADSLVCTIANSLSTHGAFIIGAIIFCLTPHPKKEGQQIMTFEKEGHEAINMNMLFSMGAALTIGAYLSDDSVGLTSLLSSLCTPLYSVLGPVGFICLLGVLAGIFTNFSNNLLGIYIFGAVGCTVFAGQPEYLSMMSVVVLLCSNMALALPSGSGPALVIHGRNDIMKTSKIISWGFLFSIVAVVFICIFAVILM